MKIREMIMKPVGFVAYGVGYLVGVVQGHVEGVRFSIKHRKEIAELFEKHDYGTASAIYKAMLMRNIEES